MANSINFGGVQGVSNNPFQIGTGSFTASNDQKQALKDTPIAGTIKSSGTAALVEGAAAIKAAYTNAQDAINNQYKLADNTLSAQQLAQQISNKDYLATDEGYNSLDSYIGAGNDATAQLTALLGGGGADAQQAAISALQNAPGFQFSLNQGTKALQASAAAKGLLNSGGLAKELTDYAQGQAQSLITQQTSNLLNLAQLGATAASQKATISGNLASQQASTQAELAAQQAQLQAQQGNTTATNASNFSSQIAGLQSQLSSQQQQLEIARAQLATQQSNTQAAQQADLLKTPAVQSLIRTVNAQRGLGAKGNAAQLNAAIKQLKALGVTGY